MGNKLFKVLIKVVLLTVLFFLEGCSSNNSKKPHKYNKLEFMLSKGEERCHYIYDFKTEILTVKRLLKDDTICQKKYNEKKQLYLDLLIYIDTLKKKDFSFSDVIDGSYMGILYKKSANNPIKIINVEKIPPENEIVALNNVNKQLAILFKRLNFYFSRARCSQSY